MIQSGDLTTHPLGRRILREPLVQFLGIAVLLVAAYRVHAVRHDRFRVVMTADRVNQLAESYRLQFGVEPAPELREALVQKDFEDEVLYREALALHLDQGDEIIRRRLIQKMQFVTQDQQAPPEPTDAQLASYFAVNRTIYTKHPQATFTHVFFSTDADGESRARTRAVAALKDLRGTAVLRAPTAGDIFPDNYDFASYEPQQVTRLFGDSEFAAAVFAAPIGEWAGPFRSAYGWHLLRVDSRRAAADPPLQDVRARVRNDYLREQQESANVKTLETTKKQFQLVRSDLKGER
jgi:peptidyl-prolyl cis-trans isomerase C